MNFAFHKIQHIGIPVTDIKKSEAFYNRLGFINVMTSTFPHNGETGQVMMLKKEEMIIEIYQKPDNELAEIKSRKAGNIDHIAFDVDDIEVAFNELKNSFFTILEEAPVFLSFWEKGCRYFNIVGPDGERLEFNQIL